MKCWNCQLSLDPPQDQDRFTCECGQVCVIRGTGTISLDEDYEARCDSEASRRYEDAAYGRLDQEEYYLEPDTQSFRDD
jgi:hypothetical protein